MKNVYFLMVLFFAFNTPSGFSQNHKPYFPNGGFNAGLLRLIEDPDRPPTDLGDNTWELHLKVSNSYLLDFEVYNGNDCNSIELMGSIQSSSIGLVTTFSDIFDYYGIRENYDQYLNFECKFGEKNNFILKGPSPSGIVWIKQILIPFIEPLISVVIKSYLIEPQLKPQFSNKLAAKIYTHYNNGVPDIDVDVLLSSLDKAYALTDFISNQLAGVLPNILNDVLLDDFSINPADFDINLENITDNLLSNTNIYYGFGMATVQGIVGGFDLSNYIPDYCMSIDFEDQQPNWISSFPTNNTFLSSNEEEVNLSWNFNDADGDPLYYNLFIKGPNDTEFQKIPFDFITNNYVFQIPNSEQGVYQWKVIAKYQFQSPVKVSSPTYTFYNCSTSNPISIFEQDFIMNCNQSGNLYDLAFNFSGSFDAEKSYTGYFSYLDEDKTSLVTIQQAIIPNESNPLNVIENLPKDRDVEIFVTDGCNAAHTIFSPYPTLEVITDFDACSSRIKLIKEGSIGSYSFTVNGSEIPSLSINESHEIPSEYDGINSFTYSITPLGSNCSQEFYHSYTCLSTLCGNGPCDPTEDCLTCPEDCGPCFPDDLDLRLSENCVVYTTPVCSGATGPVTAYITNPNAEDWQGTLLFRWEEVSNPDNYFEVLDGNSTHTISAGETRTYNVDLNAGVVGPGTYTLKIYENYYVPSSGTFQPQEAVLDGPLCTNNFTIEVTDCNACSLAGSTITVTDLDCENNWVRIDFQGSTSVEYEASAGDEWWTVVPGGSANEVSFSGDPNTINIVLREKLNSNCFVVLEGYPVGCGPVTCSPISVTLIDPEDMAEYVLSETVTFLWDIPDADLPCFDAYHIQLDTDPAFGSPYENNDYDPAFYNLSLSAPGTVYWRVRAKNTDGQWGPWTASRTVVFVDDTPPNLKLELAGCITYPDPLCTGESATVSVSIKNPNNTDWSGSMGALLYESGNSQYIEEKANLSIPAGQVRSFTFTGLVALQPSESMSLIMVEKDAGQSSAEFVEAGVCVNNITVSVSDCRPPCDPPANLTVEATSGSYARLGWTSDDNTDGHIIYWREVGQGNWNVEGYLYENHFDLFGLQPNTEYQWRMLSRCTPDGTSFWSSEQAFTTTNLGCSDLELTDLQISAVTNDNITFSATITNTGEEPIFTGYPDDIFPPLYNSIQFHYSLDEEIGNADDYAIGGELFFNNPAGYARVGESKTATFTFNRLNLCYGYLIASTDFQNSLNECDETNNTLIEVFDQLWPDPQSFTYSQLTDQSVRLSWTEIPGEYYRARYKAVGTTSWSSSPTFWDTHNWWDISDLAPCVDYEWQVSIDCGGAIGDFWSDMAFFTTECTSSCVVLLQPLSGATNVPVDQDLVWQAASGDPLGYRLQVGTSPGSGSILNDLDVGNVTSYELPPLPYNAKIYVTISPYYSTTGAENCPEYSFTTELPNSLVVINTNDTGPGSLRAAIHYANSTAGPDIISFDIPGSGPFTIQVASNLPPLIDDGITIDATTQPGFTPGMIELLAPSQNSGYGFIISADQCRIYGFKITSFETGIRMTSNSPVNWTLQVGAPGKGNICYNNANGVGVYGETPKAIIQSNEFYGDFSLNFSGVHLQSTNNIVGGEELAEGNLFHDLFRGVTYASDRNYNIWLSKNQFWCNTTPIYGAAAINTSFTPMISDATTNEISGTAAAGAAIQVFFADETCSTAPCQGRTFIGETTADGDGNWSIQGDFSGGADFVTATAKEGNLHTSTFASCREILQSELSCRYRDSLILVDLYHATNGPSWTTTWDLTQPINTWFGIKLTPQGCVSAIDLRGEPQYPGSNDYLGNNVSGILPENIGDLSELGALHLAGNQVGGTLPPSILDLSLLQELNLLSNNFTGEIPANIGQLSNLRELRLSDNDFSGPLPPSIAQLDQLWFLGLSANANLGGQLPFNIGDMVSLRECWITSTNIGGSIPASIGSLLSLTTLVVRNSNLSGTIPPELGNAQKLILIDLKGNNLTGTIPASLGNLPLLYRLDLDQNQLTGEIPASLSQASNLKILWLHDNQFTGSVPDFSDLSLQALRLSNNKLEYLPDLSGIPTWRNETYSGLQVENNHFTFEHIRPNFGIADYANFIFAPQMPIFPDSTIIATAGEKLAIDLGIDLNESMNFYYWYKNGQPYDTLIGDNRLGFPGLLPADAGVFTVEVINSLVPGLTLTGGPITLEVVPQTCRLRDSLVLVELYNATNGPNWTNSWNLNQSLDTWYGVTLNVEGCVETLSIYNNNLNGTIPLELGNLNNLTFLNLSINPLTGNLPGSLGELSQLKTLVIGSTQISGLLPAELGNLENLRTLNCQNNQLDGVLPAQLGNLTNLTNLNLYNNNFSGTIPPELKNLTKLAVLNLYDNQLTGVIPAELGNLVKLHHLRLRQNQLSGSIPSSLGDLIELETLDLSSNQLSGSIPVGLGNLVGLNYLGLHRNQLDGALPGSLSNLTNLQYLFCQDNQLSGCFLEGLNIFCSLGFSTSTNNPGYNFTNNPDLPGGGDFQTFCATGAGTCDPSCPDLLIDSLSYDLGVLYARITNVGNETADLSGINAHFSYSPSGSPTSSYATRFQFGGFGPYLAPGESYIINNNVDPNYNNYANLIGEIDVFAEMAECKENNNIAVFPLTLGCSNPNAHNYDPNVNSDDGSCQTCTDGIQNGDETDVDCGGSSCAPCGVVCDDIAINDDPIPADTYHAGNLLTSKGRVVAGTSVIFKSGGTIRLEAGFSVEAESSFQALIEACELVNPNTVSELPEEEETLLTKTSVNLKVFPNPFHEMTTIRYHLPTAGKVQIVVTDFAGRVVDVLLSATIQESGVYDLPFSAVALVAGVYNVRMWVESSTNAIQTILNERMVVIK